MAHAVYRSIGETGGINIYGFVGNDSMNGVDVYGTMGTKYPKDLTPPKAPEIGNKLKRCIDGNSDDTSDEDKEKLARCALKCMMKKSKKAIGKCLVKCAGSTLGDNALGVVCCMTGFGTANEPNPCNPSKFMCKDCCDFNFCKNVLTGSHPAGEAAKRDVCVLCCD